MYYSGTSGLVLNILTSDFPAEFKASSRLNYYATLFNSVEINSTFYKLPRAKTVTNWSESVPSNFKFTLKVPKVISHCPVFEFDENDVQNFLELIPNLGGKLGCLLLQFPPSLTIDKIDRLQEFLEIVTFFDKTIRVAIEFRNVSWYATKTHNLVQQFNASIVFHDLNGGEMKLDTAVSNFVYIRFHGNEPRYRGNYSDKELEKAATFVRKNIGAERDIYVYFNNTVGSAFENLQTFNEMVLGSPPSKNIK